MIADPGGVSALTMKKLLGLGSYQTGVGDAAPLPHRDGPAPGRELLSGHVAPAACCSTGWPRRRRWPNRIDRRTSRSAGMTTDGGPHTAQRLADEPLG